MDPSPRMLAAHLEPDSNSFNLVRLVAALLVLVSHAFSMSTGDVSLEPLSGTTPFTLGQHAVNAFFVLSGLTLAQSLERSPDIERYLWARFLRICPGLFVFGVLLAFVAGPLLTSLQSHEYFGDAHTWMYPFAVLVQFSKAVPPHEIFAGLPFAEAANTPLWTIKYEIFAYIGLAVLFRLGWTREPARLFLALAATFSVFMLAAADDPMETSPVYQMGRYGFCFVLGMIAYHYRARISIAPDLLMFPTAFLLLAIGTRFEQAAYAALMAHLIILVGARHYGRPTAWCQRHDVSYGVYIYHWPVLQILLLMIPGIGIPTLLTGSFIVTTAFAIASWHLVEQPALRLKRIHPRALFARLRVAY